MSRKTKKAESAKAAKRDGPRPMQRALTAAERKKLRGLAHALRPLVQLGLESHELVKVRLDSGRVERPALAERIAEATGAGVAGTVGQVVILFRQRVDPEERRVELGSDLYAPAG